ncbi:transporter substrate-binding domain-containing protein [Chitinivorax sp. B]|uniref:substrate-binding periplasmic protein n=1 Tax=Chitinivorax sp. B TaxID=2502235 RepID=UPI001485B80A|nr:transporter substrate-binding domain-containing protein [Chitinivorax sp. B]
MPKSLLLVTCLAISLGSTAFAVDIRTAAQVDSEPKFVTLNGAVSGICVEVMRAVEKTDPSLKFVGDQNMTPLARIESALEGGALDAACGLARNKEREGKFLFATTPLFPVNWQLAVRANDNVQISSWDDVKKLAPDNVILINFGSGAIKRVEAVGGLKLDTAGKTTNDNLQKLEAGRGRFFYYRSPGFKSELKAHAGKFRILPAVLDSSPFFMMFGKHVAKETVDKFDKALQQLSKQGDLAKLVDKWDEY